MFYWTSLLFSAQIFGDVLVAIARGKIQTTFVLQTHFTYEFDNECDGVDDEGDGGGAQDDDGVVITEVVGRPPRRMLDSSSSSGSSSSSSSSRSGGGVIGFLRRSLS